MKKDDLTITDINSVVQDAEKDNPDLFRIVSDHNTGYSNCLRIFFWILDAFVTGAAEIF